jgi:hypothetical protein
VIPRTGVSWFTGLCYSTYEFFQGTYREPVVRSDKVFYEELEGGEVYKAMLFFGVTGRGPRSKLAEANKLLRLRYPEAEFSWVEQCIEITPKGCIQERRNSVLS